MGREESLQDVRRRHEIATQGRPQDDRNELDLRLQAAGVAAGTVITFYFSAGEALGEQWSGYRVELALVPRESVRGWAPHGVLFEPPYAETIYAIIRWRVWRVGVAGFLEGWYDYDQKQERISLRDRVTGGATLLRAFAEMELWRGGKGGYLSRETFLADLRRVLAARVSNHQSLARSDIASDLCMAEVTLKRYLSKERFGVSLRAEQRRAAADTI